MNMPGFTAEASMYSSTRYYRVTPSVASIRDSGLVSMAACNNPLGDLGCYPTFDPNIWVSVCDCDGTCGQCFDLTIDYYGSHNLGSKQICQCTPPPPYTPPPGCQPPCRCCGDRDNKGVCHGGCACPPHVCP